MAKDDKGANRKTGTETGTANKTPETGTGEEGKTLTQDEVNALLARTRSEATEAANKASNEALGMDPAKAKAILEAHEAAEEAKKDDLTKATEAAEATTKLADAAIAEAQVDSLRAQFAFALTVPTNDDKGEPLPAAKPDRVETLVGMAVQQALTSEGGDDIVATTVAGLRVSVPELFGPPQEDNANGTKKPPAPTPGRTMGETSTSNPTAKENAIANYKKAMGKK